MQLQAPTQATLPVSSRTGPTLPVLPVLQISYVKSGSFFLWQTLEALLGAAGARRSFVREHPIQQHRKAWPEFSIEQFDIDQILVQDDAVSWQIETQHVEPIDDIAGYCAATSHVWTHSPLCERSWEVYPRFGRRCYIVRDPRDALVSMAHFVQTPFMRRYHPHPAESPEEYVASELTPFLEQWCRHVDEHRRAAGALDIEFLHYERMTQDLRAAVRHLADWLDLGLDSDALATVADSVSLGKMRQHNPQHVRRGGSGGYRALLSTAQQKRAHVIVAPTMRDVGYDV